MLYAHVILPLRISPLTYGFDPELMEGVVVGATVMVELGARKLYEGIVWSVSDQRPDYKLIKNIIRVTESGACVDGAQMRLWEWMASYYMCTLGEVMRAALPSNLKIGAFSQDEFAKQQTTGPVLKVIGLHPDIASSADLELRLQELKRSKAQHRVLLSITQRLGEGLFCGGYMVADKQDRPTVKKLIDSGLLIEKQVAKSYDQEEQGEFSLPELTDAQQSVFGAINQHFESKDVVLLHGITGSGKTEIYMNLLAQSLEQGQDVLYLLPEIALTAQLIDRLKVVFGERVVAYHSRFGNKQRSDVYRRVVKSRGNLIIGVRSAVFLPFPNLGLVVIDEEHENSFKQMDPAPYYNGRDTAVMLATIHKAKVVMGSATPSIESYVNAQAGKYAYVELTERYAGARLPKIILSDTLRSVKRGERHSHFNKIMLDKIGEALSSGSQVMLFQNRRGFSPYIECPECGWVAHCPHCNVSLTLHRNEGKLKCHYCGYQIAAVSECPACHKAEPKTMGFGTEKIEDELLRLFPEARVARLDADTAKSRTVYNKIVADFQQRKLDVLVGTQMITKGFDFPGVSLVGVLNADNLMNHPDFRASERAFQLMTQVAGRAGRREKQGEVVIQTSQIDSPLLQQVLMGDYGSMVRAETVLRESFNYPPYCKVIDIQLRHSNKKLLWMAASRLEEMMRKVFARRVLGPQAPSVDKVKGLHYLGFMLKVERQASYQRAKMLLSEMIQVLNESSEFRYVDVICNVDP